MNLPVDETLPALAAALRDAGAAVLQAPPGAGKTTRVPLALLDAAWLAGARIVMLEPRRLAARAAAHHMARLLGERVGDAVGYRIRGDTRVSAATRVEVVTEGVLTRLLQADPSLAGVGLVIFDEFHERSVHADLGLALTLQARSLFRPELRLLVMSATLDGASVAELLGSPVVTSEGRSWPVETRYSPGRPSGHMEPAVTRTVLRALAEQTGDVLVFLPGAAEIRRVRHALPAERLPPEVEVLPLYGNLPQTAQERAIAPATPGRRKVVLATSIAETSLTIEGVRVVVDSGVMRVPRFSPRTGMTRLVTVPVTRASADQRRGRAGRLGPGVCYRLWSEQEHAALAVHGVPEILEADLAPLALELAVWGEAPAALQWLDPPPPSAFAQARELLAALGALDAHGAITTHGAAMAALPLHPRLAHMLLRAQADASAGLACDLAALLSTRFDVPDPDVRLRLEAMRAAGTPTHVAGHPVDRGALARVRAEAADLRRRLGIPTAPRPGPLDGIENAGAVLALAYPDRVGQRRPGTRGRYRLRNGRGAVIDASSALAGEEWVVAAVLEGGGRESRVFLGAPLQRTEVDRLFGGAVVRERVVEWDDAAAAVRAREVDRLGALVLREVALAEAAPDAVAAALLAGVRRRGLDVLPWPPAAAELRQRLAFLHHHEAAWPDVSDAALLATLEDWLAPSVTGRPADVRRLDTARALTTLLDGRQRAALDTLAPSHIVVPSGSRVPVRYEDPASPVLAVRLQEVFGLTRTPRLAGGRVPVTLHLLSPAHRPVQVTRDLESFWSSGYFDVRRELKGRYPRHHWPDDPLAAPPTRRAKPRG